MTAHDWLVGLDTYANGTYGRPVSSAIAGGTCVSCGRVAREFTNAKVKAVYAQAGLCERCQNAHQSISDTIVPFNQNYSDRVAATVVKAPRRVRE